MSNFMQEKSQAKQSQNKILPTSHSDLYTPLNSQNNNSKLPNEMSHFNFFSRPILWLFSIFAGIIGAIFAVLCCFFTYNTSSLFIILSMAFLEELLKPIALVFLLEKHPNLIRFSEQFFIIGILSGFFFGISEIMFYKIYFIDIFSDSLEKIMLIQWISCLFLHISCSIICIMGLRRAWCLQKNKYEHFHFNFLPTSLYFLLASLIHASYNFYYFFYNI